MFCIVSFIVLSILGIFSASNRELARESLDCVLRRVTLRPCNTGFDEKMKARILGVVITRSEGAAMFLNRYFELLSWAFFILMLSSIIFSVRGLALFYTTGSCNGANSEAFCVFDPSGSNNQTSTVSQGCTKPVAASEMTARLNNIDLTQFPTLNSQSGQKIIMIACYHCDYSRKAYPEIRALADHNNLGLIFLHYPVKESTDHFSKISYCVNKLAAEKFWAFNDEMFKGNKADLDNPEYVDGLLTSVGLDADQINACAADPATEKAVQEQMHEIVRTGFQGTPTVFINDQVFVGPKPYRVYAIASQGLLYWLR
ncbi:MAG TPA: DsbA family protein [Anaerolineaceae bacterium]|nr:DsbA family protein [Anaerolineaceae bacterium]